MTQTAAEKAVRKGTPAAWIAQLARRDGWPVSTTSGYRGWQNCPTLIPQTVRLRMCPAVPIAVLEASVGVLGAPWRWQTVIANDDMVRIVSDGGDSRVAAFQGFVTDVDWGFDAAHSTVRITAAGRAQRLLKDRIVYGRHMLGADGSPYRYTGLPLRFNADGRANRSVMPLGSVYTYAGAVINAFTFDGDPQACYWTGPDAVRYLLGIYNADNPTPPVWIANATLSAALAADARPIAADCEGLSLWEALAAVCDAAGYDAWEAFTMSAGNVVSTIHVAMRGEGALRQLRHQAMPDAGPEGLTDETNLFAANVAESVTSCITTPTIIGSAARLSCWIELYQAWKPALLVVDATERRKVILPADRTNQYHRKFVAGGDLFVGDYRLVGRLWDANTDGRYTQSLGLPEGDVAAACGCQTKIWPRMPYPPLPETDLAGVDLPVRYKLLVTGGGVSLQPAGGWHVLPDRLAVYLTVDNLADWEDADLMTALLTAPAAVKMYLSCEVASPFRETYTAPRRAGAGTAFNTTAAFDRGTIDENLKRRTEGGGARRQSAYSRLAELVQAACEDRNVEAAFELPWPETEILLGDRIERIVGIGYSFKSGSGAAARYPRVVGIELGLDVETHNTQYTLDTDRKAPVR